MKIRMPAALSGAILMAVMLLPSGGCAADSQSPAEGAENPAALTQFSKASEQLYKKVSGSIVRVKVDQMAMGLPRELMKEFQEWRQKQADAGGTGNGPLRRRLQSEGAAATMPARGGGAAGQPGSVRKFLEQKLKDSPDAETQARLRAVIARIDALRSGLVPSSEMIGVVIDDQGHAIVAGWNRDNQTGTYRVTVPDGTEITAKYVGAHFGRSMAILKLESPGSTVPLPIAPNRPAPGELLMAMAAHQGAVTWVTAPGAPASGKKVEDRFPIVGEDHSGAYLFNTQGELSAIGIDHMALPVNKIKNDIDWIIKNNKDISGVGVRYDPVPPEVRKNTPALGNRPAYIVREVAPGSPADKASLKKDDILLTIDGRSVWELPAILRDLATKTGTAPMEILRDGKEMTLEIPLGG